jgi:hypothetical protein
MTRLGAFLGSAALVGLFAGPAQATPLLEQTLIATGGDIVVTFVSNGAALSSELWLDGDAGDELGAIFNNWTTAAGTSMDLGSFAEGTELVFKLLVAKTGNVFYTGPAARNPDGVVHSELESGTDQTLVGFEDLFGGGDRDYNDLVFAFTNVMPTASSGAAGADGVSNTGGVSNSGDVSNAGGAPTTAGTPTAAGTPVFGSTPLAEAESSAEGAPATVTVDEPSTLLMLGSGLSMLVFAIKRKRAF